MQSPTPPHVEGADGGEAVTPPRPKALAFEHVPSPTKKPGQQLSEGAIYKRLKRVFTPRADGSYIVPKEFVDKYKDLQSRQEVELLFEKCDYCPDTWPDTSFPLYWVSNRNSQNPGNLFVSSFPTHILEGLFHLGPLHEEVPQDHRRVGRICHGCRTPILND